jgi:hypothetical protein
MTLILAVKQCTFCKQELPLEAFYANRTKPDGKGNICKPCKKNYTRDYWISHRKGVQWKARNEAQIEVRNYLRTHPCVDCGETDIIVLDFDHLRDKSYNVGIMIQRGMSWSKILEEIMKCEVVCANDHRRRTARTQDWHRLSHDE